MDTQLWGAALSAYPNNWYTCCMNTKDTNTTTKRTRVRTPNNRTPTGFRISDDLWQVLKPLLPPHVNTHRFGGGRPRVPDRRCADAIFYVLRTGCQWDALTQTELCAKSTAYDRFRSWVEAGVFVKLWQAGLQHFDELKGLDWSWLSMDGALNKAPLGGEKNRSQSDRPRQKRQQAQPAQ
jgi:transposase